MKHAEDQVAEIAAHAGLENTAFGAATRCEATGYFTERHGSGEGHFGNCIVSRYPIVDTKKLIYGPYGSKSPRGAVAGLVEVPDIGRIWIVSTHLGMCLHGGEQVILVTHTQNDHRVKSTHSTLAEHYS